jgi:hypothetical protein
MFFLEKIITECFQALASWLIVRPNVFLTDYELSMKLFQVVELGLFGKLGSDLAQPVTTESVVAASVEHTVEKDDRKKKKEEKKLTKDLKKRSTEVQSLPLSHTLTITTVSTQYWNLFQYVIIF